MSTLEEKIQATLGAQLVEILRLNTVLEQAKARIEELEAKPAPKTNGQGEEIQRD